jgi:hypothetical protein
MHPGTYDAEERVRVGGVPVHCARVASKRRNRARALWYLAPARDLSRPSILTLPERSSTRHSQSLRFRLIANSKGAGSAVSSLRVRKSGHLWRDGDVITLRPQPVASGQVDSELSKPAEK